MKEIGQNFKEARQKIGLSKDEVIKDLEITSSQLDNLEDGNANAFKDVFFLKDLVKKYAKYLNLDEDSIMDEFNNFIFGYTSRIPISDILEQTREINLLEKNSDDNKIISPYTRKVVENKKYWVYYIIGAVLLAILLFFIINIIKNNNKKSNLTESINYNYERSI